MERCRWCADEVKPCQQQHHSCRNGMVHLDGTHECGWFDYLTRIYGSIHPDPETGTCSLDRL